MSTVGLGGRSPSPGSVTRRTARYAGRVAGHFSSDMFGFLRDLESNNRREWFEDNRARYVASVEEPMLRFIDDLRPRLAAISSCFVADPRRSGGSMFRIYRDTRFSADKAPYKTHAAARFGHRQQEKGQAGPGFYLHLEPGDCLGGGGIYRPDSAMLARIRRTMVEDAKAWRAVRKLGLEIEGDVLKRVPAGHDAAHPFADDLRRKDLYVLQPFTQRDVCAPDFIDRYVETCEGVAPLVSFLTRAAGWKW